MRSGRRSRFLGLELLDEPPRRRGTPARSEDIQVVGVVAVRGRRRQLGVFASGIVAGRCRRLSRIDTPAAAARANRRDAGHVA
jgi:hypothetical protein